MPDLRGLLSGLSDRLLDATVVRSFDAAGFRRHSRHFDASDLDVDLSHRHVVITGANSGLGLASAHALAARGARLSLLCRSAERGERARQEVVERSGNERVRLVRCDLSSLVSCVEAARELVGETVDVLVHNAGVLPSERTLLPGGMELTLATNLVGPHRLTAELMPALWRSAAATGDARLVFVSSGGMYTQRLDVEALDNTSGRFEGAVAYARTKRAQVVLGEELARLWAGTGLRVAVMHPGWADTPGVQTSLPGFSRVMQGALRTPEQGADTTIWLAAREAAPEPSGALWFDREVVDSELLPGTHSTEAQRERLWTQLLEWSEVSEAAFLPPV